MAEVITEFIDIATVKVWAYVYTEAEALADPTAITLNIYDHSGTLQVDGEAMTKSETGIYYYYYHKGASEDPMDKGNWRGTIIVADGTGDETIYSTKDFAFKVR